MNKKMIGGLVVLLVAAGIIAGVGLSKQGAQDSANGPYDSSATDSTPTTSASHETTNPGAGGGLNVSVGVTGTTYAMADVAAHNSGASCWTAINGGVYDVTSWIKQHPGGQQAILSLCGTDGSAAFNGQHGGQARPASELATFKIGTLAQ